MKEYDFPVCPYCGEVSLLTSSAEVYGGRDFGMIYLCRPCNAYVGVHKGTTRPLGSLAGPQLRRWRRSAHAAFDPLWRGRGRKARSRAYAWLAEKMGIDKSSCHIGHFDAAACQKVIEICEAEQNFPG